MSDTRADAPRAVVQPVAAEPTPAVPVLVKARDVPGWLSWGMRSAILVGVGSVLHKVADENTVGTIMADPTFLFTVAGGVSTVIWGALVKFKQSKTAAKLAAWLPDNWARVI